MGVAVADGHMGDTIRGERISIDGAGTYDEVDCEEFVVNGSGKVSGDLYATTVDIDGTAKVGGLVDAVDLDVDGTAKVEGDVRGETASVDGTAKFANSLSADRLAVDGTAKVGGNLDGHDVEADGTLKVSGSLVAADARFDGTLKVGGVTDATTLTVDGTGAFDDVNADEFSATGSVRADSVSARTVDVTVEGRSKVGSVEATEVRVRPGEGARSLASKLLGDGDRVFEVDTVEAETVELDATHAGTVVGDSVTLGPDAEVDVVYTDDLDGADATVGDVRPREEY
jgi:cytoskeletal protein CcmA (bactofilin family)